MRLVFVLSIILKFFVSEGKLFFPPHSDVGYIIPENEEHPDPESLVPNAGPLISSPDHIPSEHLNSLINYITERKINLGYMKKLPENLKDSVHGIKMGIRNSKCDDGITGLSIDWDESPENYTCPSSSPSLPFDSALAPINECIPISPYTQIHHCMDQSIRYNTNIPTFGDHRPLWPIYGEYRFIPMQRWLHSIEHGAVVMLYHPCAKDELVSKLKSLVKSCLFRHIITPHNLLSQDRPLALAAWGCKLEMAYVDEEMVKHFIKSHALKGPEGFLYQNGQFDQELIQRSSLVKGSDQRDSNLCPQ